MRILSLPTLLCAMLFSSCAFGSSKVWEQCLRQIPSQELKEAEDKGGKLYVNEYLIDRCGPRPAVTQRHGKSSLRKEDCDQLFAWAQDGACVIDDMAEYQKAILKQLDPAAFNESQYVEICTAMSTAGTKPVRRALFGQKVCEK